MQEPVNLRDRMLASNGFIDIYGLPSRVAAARDVKFGNGIEVPKNTVE